MSGRTAVVRGAMFYTFVLLDSWAIMLALGALHAEVPAVPALRYVTCAVVFWALAWMVGTLAWTAAGTAEQSKGAA